MKKPMLAHKFNINRVDYTQPDGYYIQPKLDGVRCLFTANGAYSRNNKKFMNLQKHLVEQKQEINSGLHTKNFFIN